VSSELSLAITLRNVQPATSYDDEAPCLAVANIVNGDDVWMTERLGCLRFLHKAAHPFGILGEFRRQQFERDFAAQSLIFGEINFAHPTPI
jgi:hypothetical protein